MAACGKCRGVNNLRVSGYSPSTPPPFVEDKDLKPMATAGDDLFCVEQRKESLKKGAFTMTKKSGKTKSKRLAQGWLKHIQRMKQAARKTGAPPR